MPLGGGNKPYQCDRFLWSRPRRHAACVVGRVGYTLGRTTPGRGPERGAAPVGALLPPPGGPGPQETPGRAAAGGRRGGRGPERLRQLLPRPSPGPLPAAGRPGQPVAAAGDPHGPQGVRSGARRTHPEARRRGRQRRIGLRRHSDDGLGAGDRAGSLPPSSRPRSRTSVAGCSTCWRTPGCARLRCGRWKATRPSKSPPGWRVRRAPSSASYGGYAACGPKGGRREQSRLSGRIPAIGRTGGVARRALRPLRGRLEGRAGGRAWKTTWWTRRSRNARPRRGSCCASRPTTDASWARNPSRPTIRRVCRC